MFSEKKSNQNFKIRMWKCTCTQYVHFNYKVSNIWNSVERFKRGIIPRKKATQFQEILLSGFALTNCFSSIIIFGQISKFKGGIIPGEINWIKTFFFKYVHLHIMFLITTNFNEILLSGFRGVVLTKKPPKNQKAHGLVCSPEKPV